MTDSLKTHPDSIAAKFMPNASGISAVGNATLLNNVIVFSRQMSIAITNQRLPPQRRMGYFWLYSFENVAPSQHYVMESGIIYAPGVWIPIRIAPFSPNYLYRLDVTWNLAGFPWTATII